MKKYLLLIAAFILFFGGLFLGYRIFRPVPKEVVTSNIILTALQSEGFLVSQNYIFNQTITIDRSTGSAFKDFFLGQTIEANANMKVSSGIDLKKMSEKDIAITDTKIQIILPQVETQSTELLGNIVLKNRQGILKKIVDNDDGYNAAFTKLKREAMKSVEVPELREEAKINAQKEIKRFVGFIDPQKEVIFK
jgi:hypothetical protein